MAVNTFNTEEAIQKLDKAIEALEPVAAIMQKGIDNSVAVAEDSKSPKFIASAHAMQEAAPTLIKQTIPELLDSMKALRNEYKRLEEAM